MPRSPQQPWGPSPYSRTRRTIHPTALVPSGSPLTPNLTQSTSRNPPIAHVARPPVHLVSLGDHNRRPLGVYNKSQTSHEAPGYSRSFPSPMISRTLSSGQILIYLRDTAATDRTVAEFREKLTGFLGFDIEYRPNFMKGHPLNKTALVQLASESIILLVQVSAMSAFPDTIRNIIEDDTIIKAGVGIQADADKLWRDFGISAASCLELGYLARAIDQQWAESKGLISLARLVKAYEDRVIKKPKYIQRSNWEMSLTEEQQDYAASDAVAALTVLRKLYAILPSVEPPPDKTVYLF